MHTLEAGFEMANRPCVLLLHGFPELAYSWRKVMPALAAAGFHVIAPDQRSYGRTTGWDGSYDGDVGSFRLLNLAKDALGLVSALGYRSVAAVVGHDYGSPVAAWCALVRPDVFHSVALLSAPFAGPLEPPDPFSQWIALFEANSRGRYVAKENRPVAIERAMCPEMADGLDHGDRAQRNRAGTGGILDLRQRAFIGTDPIEILSPFHVEELVLSQVQPRQDALEDLIVIATS
jgi:pimeloyl-ACP methyl ester carboxylesterase